MNVTELFYAYNSTMKKGDYVFTYTSPNPTICTVENVNGTMLTLRSAYTGRLMRNFRHTTDVALLPGFTELPKTHPELFI